MNNTVEKISSPEVFRKVLNAWLDENDAWRRGEAKILTQKEWVDRDEEHGLTATGGVLIIEGSPLYLALNHGEPNWSQQEELIKLCDEHGYWHEFMYAWALCFYRKED